MCDRRILIIFNSVTFVSFCFRCGGMTFSKSLNGSFESTQLVRNAKVDILFFSFIFLFYWSNIVCQKYKLTRTVFFFLTLQKEATELDLSAEVATRLHLVDKDTTAVRLPDAHPSHSAFTRHSDEDIPKLTKVRENYYLRINLSTIKKTIFSLILFVSHFNAGNGCGGVCCFVTEWPQPCS